MTFIKYLLVVITMWTIKLLIIVYTTLICASDKIEEPTTYYYGLEESERGLPACAPRQACSVYTSRYWRTGALVRLCRCDRRRPCPVTPNAAADRRTVPLNNRAHFKFCEPVTNWPQCSVDEIALVVHTINGYDRLDPEEIEELHHRDVHLLPPKITFNCLCPEPNYWRMQSSLENGTQHVKCQMLDSCNSGEFCGNFRYDLDSLYQSCLCPRHHICVHNGGVIYTNITELMYRGKGRQAYCQRIGEDDDYYYLLI